MFQKLVNHNPDLHSLVKKGYAVSFDSNYLVIKDVPDRDAQVLWQLGVIVDKLVLTDGVEAKQNDHQIHFAGSSPHGLDGKPIANLGDRGCTLPLNDSEVVVQRAFSNKPKATGKFGDFFEKIESYVALISGPAIEKFDATPYTYRSSEVCDEVSVFKFSDTLTSRAGITDLSKKFKNEKVAIIGLGGTGGYILDYIVKTPVDEIIGFDNDEYHVHNSFRSPGGLKKEELNQKKSNVYASRYEEFRSGIKLHDKHLDSSCADDLKGVTFAFVCVDSGTSRNEISNLLIRLEIPFIDVGMGLSRKNEMLSGMLRTTHFSSGDTEGVLAKGLVETSSDEDNIYKTNIQIAELNAMNACFAVLKYKQLKGFYFEDDSSFHSLFCIEDMSIVGAE